MGDVTFTAMTKFDAAMRLELNQQKPLLAPTVLSRDCAGAEKRKIDNLIANSKTSKKTTRAAAVTYNDTGWDGIWVVPPETDFIADIVDNDDQLLTDVDIGGGYVMSHSGAINRAWDDAFILGFYGDLITGKTGTTLNAFPAANIVPVTHGSADGLTPVGMNVAKLKRARRVLAGNYVNMDQPIYMGLGSQQIEELLGEVEVTSADFVKLGGRMSADGKHLLGMLGFIFVEIELGNPLFENADLTVDGSGYRKTPFWTADGVVMCPWERLFTSIDPLPQNHHAKQVYSRTRVAASRTDQNRCGYILNFEAP